MAYGNQLAGLCAATALFVCAASGAPVAPSTLPALAERDGALIVNGHDSISEASIGTALTMSAAGFLPNANVTFVVYSEPVVLAEVTADATGTATASAQVPNLVGQHTLTAIGLSPNRDARLLSTQVEIVSTPSAPGGLPATGVSIGLGAASGVGLLIVGAMMTRAARLRRTARR